MFDAVVSYADDSFSVPFDLEAKTFSEAIEEILSYHNSEDAALEGSLQDFGVEREFITGAYDRYVLIAGHIYDMVDGEFTDTPRKVEVWLFTKSCQNGPLKPSR